MDGFCELVEIEGKAGFQVCRKCGRPRFWPKGQTRPKPMPERYRRECPGKPVDDAEPVAPKQSRGLGDTVANVIHRVTRGHVKPCGGCKKRQKRLNEMFPYRNPKDVADDGRAG